MEVKIKRLHNDAIEPSYATAGAACFDLHAVDLKENGAIGIGLAFEIPADHVMLIFSRSGMGFKHGVRLANCVGVIDSDYRGEVMVMLTNDRKSDFNISLGDRVAQAMIIPIPQVRFYVVDDLLKTARGSDGLGSTGA